uniref:Spindle pole body component n=1 Tax=Palpitomonas bilix TaxID=652834 RepID=A0A7S3GGZ1_9EUKA
MREVEREEEGEGIAASVNATKKEEKEGEREEEKKGERGEEVEVEAKAGDSEGRASTDKVMPNTSEEGGEEERRNSDEMREGEGDEVSEGRGEFGASEVGSVNEEVEEQVEEKQREEGKESKEEEEDPVKALHFDISMDDPPHTSHVYNSEDMLKMVEGEPLSHLLPSFHLRDRGEDGDDEVASDPFSVTREEERNMPLSVGVKKGILDVIRLQYELVSAALRDLYLSSHSPLFIVSHLHAVRQTVLLGDGNVAESFSRFLSNYTYPPSAIFGIAVQASQQIWQAAVVEGSGVRGGKEGESVSTPTSPSHINTSTSTSTEVEAGVEKVECRPACMRRVKAKAGFEGWAYMWSGEGEDSESESDSGEERRRGGKEGLMLYDEAVGVSLHYKAVWPVDVVLPSTTQSRLSGIGRALLSLRLGMREVARTSTALRTIQRSMTARRRGVRRGERRGPSHLSRFFRSITACRSVVKHVMSTLNDYAVFEVVDVEWTQLLSRLRSCSSVPDILVEVDGTLTKIERGLLLFENGKALRVILADFLSFAFRLRVIVEGVMEVVEGIMAGRDRHEVDEDEERWEDSIGEDRIEEVEALTRSFHSRTSFFVSVLSKMMQHHQMREKLSSLLLRLNFNQYYEEEQ